MKHFNCLLPLLLLGGLTKAQNGDMYQESGFRYEEEKELEATGITDRINLNQCSLPDLLRIPGMTEELGREILLHRQISGDYQNWYELQVLSRMNRPLFEQIKKYALIHEKQLRRPTGKNQIRFASLVRSNKEAGYFSASDSLRFMGSAWRQRFQMQLYAGTQWKLTLGAEKDAGEKWAFQKEKPGADFLSFSSAYSFRKIPLNILTGDFRFHFGQGLIFDGPGATKAFDALLLYKSRQGISSYRGFAENGFYRGAATEYQWKDWKIAMFASSLKEDSHFQEGMHRNLREMTYRRQIRKSVAGTCLRKTFKKGHIGWNQFLFRSAGRWHYQGSLDYGITRGTFFFFGEQALKRNKPGGLHGVIWQNGAQWQTSLLLRAYPREWEGGSAFGEFSENSNERGLYIQSSWQKNKKYRVAFYLDYYYRPAPSYFVHRPYGGREYAFEMQRLAPVSFLLRLRSENFSRNNRDEQTLQISDCQRLSFRIEVFLSIDEFWQLKGRYEYNQLKEKERPDGQGSLFFLDLQWTPEQYPCKLAARITRFQTDGYDNRIYSREKDLPGEFSFPFYDGNGYSFYWLGSFQLGKWKCGGRYGWLWLEEEKKSGSGVEALVYQKRHELKLHLQWSW